MKNFRNNLLGLEFDEKCFDFLKGELQSEFDLNLFFDMLSLPIMKFKTQDKLFLLLNLIKDGKYSETIISALCELLTDVNGEVWDNISGFIEEIADNVFYRFERRDKLRLAHALEILFAKCLSRCGIILGKLYERIPLNNTEFLPDSDENIRIKLAKHAYSCNMCNCNEKLKELKSIKKHMKLSGNIHQLGSFYFYKGICLLNSDYQNDGKDSSYYMIKAKNHGFLLATIFVEHMQFHVETSRKNCKR